MKDNASKFACDRLMYPDSPIFAENIRHFQGCPTLAITKNGRIFLGWYSGGECEPHMENYNLLIYSDDHGKTWSKPVLIIPSSKELCIHALDIQLWTAPNGDLHIYWVQNNTEPDDDREIIPVPGKPVVRRYGYIFSDMRHTEWRVICKNPDADTLVFEEPECLDQGFLRCKPLVLQNGRIINFNYDQTNTRYGFSISDDQGKTYERHYGSEKISTFFDEAMAYQRLDGVIRMFARTSIGQLAESLSEDNGISWTKAVPSGIVAPDTRFYINRLPSGRLLLIASDHATVRCRLTAYLSEDDGATWRYKKLIDARESISYPDADIFDGRIYLSYDRERIGAKEILFTSFTEKEIMDPDFVCPIAIVSKP